MPAARGHSQKLNVGHENALPRHHIWTTPGARPPVQAPPADADRAPKTARKPRNGQISRSLTRTLYVALLSLATMLAGGSDTRSIAEGHRQLSAQDTRLLKGAWREAARLRQGLPEVPATIGFAGQVASEAPSPTTLDRPEALWDLPFREAAPASRPRLEPAPTIQITMLRVAESASSPPEIVVAEVDATASLRPATTNPVTWPDLPVLRPIPLPAPALLPAVALRPALALKPNVALENTQPTPPAPPAKAKASARVEPQQRLAKVPKVEPTEAEPDPPVVHKTTARAQAPATPRPAPAAEFRSHTFDNLSQSAP